MLVAGVPLLFIGAIIFQQFEDVYRNKITDHLTTLVKKHSRSIDNFLTDRLGDKGTSFSIVLPIENENPGDVDTNLF